MATIIPLRPEPDSPPRCFHGLAIGAAIMLPLYAALLWWLL